MALEQLYSWFEHSWKSARHAGQNSGRANFSSNTELMADQPGEGAVVVECNNLTPTGPYNLGKFS